VYVLILLPVDVFLNVIGSPSQTDVGVAVKSAFNV
jgi:hypothetical protein